MGPSIVLAEGAVTHGDSGVANELGVDDDWARSFAQFQEKRRRLRAAELETENPNAMEDPIETKEEFPDTSSDQLRELMKLEADGLAVSWPRGLDVLTASSVLQRRALKEPAGDG